MKLNDIINEVSDPAQQAAIAIAIKQADKKPKNKGTVDKQFQSPKKPENKRNRFKSFRKESKPQFSTESIKFGDRVRTRSMSHSGIVESIELYRPFNELAVYFRTRDNQLMRTPLSNVIRIPLNEIGGVV